MALGLLALLAVASLNVPAWSERLDSPAFCGSCHVMSAQVESHLRSSHRDVACGHCHLPRGIVRYPAAKAYAGAKDVVVFLSGATPETLRLASGGRDIVQDNCLRCHGDLVQDTSAGGGNYCWDCHRSVPHGP